jgi:hypothetical protein
VRVDSFLMGPSSETLHMCGHGVPNALGSNKVPLSHRGTSQVTSEHFARRSGRPQWNFSADDFCL